MTLEELEALVQEHLKQHGNDAEKSLVTKLATDINGVTSVINNMTVAVQAAAM